ncbi:putative deoxyribonuclease RhsA [Gammaproteobacteria bacterium]|nr:putative deoxyribonuclease RhsA [Gammaproteobacteria bacterium]
MADADIADTLESQHDAAGNRVGWRFTDAASRVVERYDSVGRLASVIHPGGYTQTLGYDISGNYLAQVQDSYGRRLLFAYDLTHRLAKLTDPAGNVYTYAYDTSNLAAVTYPDGKSRRYLYNEPAFTANTYQPNALTGVIDENDVRFATFRYDAAGRPVSTEHADGIGKHVLSYGADGSVTVTDPLGTRRVYGFQPVVGVMKSTGQSQPAGSGCQAGASQLGYDAGGNVIRRADFNGNLTCRAYGPGNLEAVRVEGIAPGGTCPADLAAYTPRPGSAERKTSTVWHASLRLPARIDEAGRSILFDYDAGGNLTGKTAIDTATGQARAWAWTYDAQGQILSEDGPRTDVADITRYEYYADTTATHRPGDLWKTTNAAGHVTTFTAYDPNGRLLSMADPNGLMTDFAYDPHGRLTAKAVDGNATAFEYDAVGNLRRVTLPTGVVYRYDYDSAHRLTDITDALGGKIHYTLDAAGNRTKEDIFEADGTLVKTHRRQYDDLGRLAQDVGAYNQATVYEYDANNQTTSYQYGGLGELLQETGPNRGTIRYAYDSAGNLTQKTDAAGTVAAYTYDALNRPLGIDYPGTEADVVYRYDGKPYLSAYCKQPGNWSSQKGRLTAACRGRVPAFWLYDPRGYPSYSWTARADGTGTTNATLYEYDPDGQLAGSSSSAKATSSPMAATSNTAATPPGAWTGSR